MTEIDPNNSHHRAVIMTAQAARLLLMIDLPAALEAIAMAESVGPLFDPTLWIEKNEAMAQDKEFLEAALPLWQMAKRIEKLGTKA